MYTAVLHDWEGFKVGESFKLKGKIFGDTKKRYEDGVVVITSAVEFIEDTTLGKIASTVTGNRYLLVK